MYIKFILLPQLDSVHEGGPVSQYRRGDSLTEEEKRDNLRLLEERVESAFPQEEMADPLYRDKVGPAKGMLHSCGGKGGAQKVTQKYKSHLQKQGVKLQ